MVLKAFDHLALTELCQSLLPSVFLHALLLAFLFPLFTFSVHDPLLESLLEQITLICSALCSSSQVHLFHDQCFLNFPEVKNH